MIYDFLKEIEEAEVRDISLFMQNQLSMTQLRLT